VGDALHERMRRLDSLMSQAGTSHAARPMACGQESLMMQGRSSAFAIIAQQHASYCEFGRNDLDRQNYKAAPAYQPRDTQRSYQPPSGTPPLPVRAFADDMPRVPKVVEGETFGGRGPLKRRTVYSNTEW
jgi:hypothetical protein